MKHYVYARLPRLFWEDHRDRGLPSGKLLEQHKHVSVVLLSVEEFYELENDARYYSEAANFSADLRPLCRSAARTVAALRKLGAEAGM